jgi:hypothetical protein
VNKRRSPLDYFSGALVACALQSSSTAGRTIEHTVATATAYMPGDCLPSPQLGLRLLLDNTDACLSVFTCQPDTVVELRKQTAQCAQRASRPAVRHAQSLFGSFRRTYAPVLQQHPSLPVDLHKLRLDMERALSTSSPPKKSLDIVLTRCMDSISPAFRVLPAALTDLGHVRAKAVVFERCAPGQHLGELPTLDARDRILRVRRLVLRSNKTRTRQTDATTTGAGATDEIYPYMPAAISSYVTSSSGDEADLVLFLFPAAQVPWHLPPQLSL